MTKLVRPLHERVQRRLDDLLGRRVDAAGRLVEDENPRIRQQRPGKGDQLPLADAQIAAVLAHLGLVTARACA